jgi:hypothetical protein
MSDEQQGQDIDDDGGEDRRPGRPVDPGPAASPHDQQAYAQAVAAWDKWLLDHPGEGDDDGVTQELEKEQERDAGKGDEE